MWWWFNVASLRSLLSPTRNECFLKERIKRATSRRVIRGLHRVVRTSYNYCWILDDEVTIIMGIYHEPREVPCKVPKQAEIGDKV